MRSFALATGSLGNSFLIESKNKNYILVDIGLSFKRIDTILKQKGISIEDIGSVFLTHEHIDHVLGLDLFLKKTNVDIYLTQGTLDSLNLKRKENINIIKNNQIILIDDIKIFVLSKSHDAKEPVNFIFENGKKLGIFTDMGYVNSQTTEILKGLDVIYFEANYCEDLLNKSNDFNVEYINRIGSNLGHLSVQNSIEILKQICNDNQKIILSHISQNTNNYTNTYKKIKSALENCNIFCNISISFQNEATDWII